MYIEGALMSKSRNIALIEKRQKTYEGLEGLESQGKSEKKKKSMKWIDHKFYV